MLENRAIKGKVFLPAVSNGEKTINYSKDANNLKPMLR